MLQRSIRNGHVPGELHWAAKHLPRGSVGHGHDQRGNLSIGNQAVSGRLRPPVAQPVQIVNDKKRQHDNKHLRQTDCLREGDKHSHSSHQDRGDDETVRARAQLPHRPTLAA